MSTKYESFVSDGTNTVFNTKHNFASKTVKVQIDNKNYDLFEELGNNFIMFQTVPKEGALISIEYTLEGSVDPNTQDEYDIKKRLAKLEEALIALNESNVLLKKALDNRISVSAFEAWITLIEKKLGITLSDEALGHVSKELYKLNLGKVYK